MLGVWIYNKYRLPYKVKKKNIPKKVHKQKTPLMWGYSTSLEEFFFFIWMWPNDAPNAAPKPMPNIILFWDTPIVIPIASPAHHPIILCVIFFISKSTHRLFVLSHNPIDCLSFQLSALLSAGFRYQALFQSLFLQFHLLYSD